MILIVTLFGNLLEKQDDVMITNDYVTTDAQKIISLCFRCKINSFSQLLHNAKTKIPDILDGCFGVVYVIEYDVTIIFFHNFASNHAPKLGRATNHAHTLWIQ